MFEILPIRRTVEHRSAVATLQPNLLIVKVLEVQIFTKTTTQVVIDAEKLIMRQSHDSMIYRKVPKISTSES